MPVDFERVPPRVAVPPPPQLSFIACAILFIAALGVGVALTILLWPAGHPTNTPRFWLFAVGYPVLAWSFGVFSWLSYGHVKRNGAIATNRVSDEAEQKCHIAAGKSLAILGRAWRYSSSDKENDLAALKDGQVRLTPRASRFEPDTEVLARWIEIPERPYYAGNELTECTRHDAVCDWLMRRLMDDIAPLIAALPARTLLQVELHVQSALEVAGMREQLKSMLVGKWPALRVTVGSEDESLSLFRVDGWLDDNKPQTARLLVAIQLRSAISEGLKDGVAESGVALLVGHPHLATDVEHLPVELHRPAKGPIEKAAVTLELATRWGQTTFAAVNTAWTHAVSSEFEEGVRRSQGFGEHVKWMELDSMVGDCSRAGAWLATVLAAENAALTGDSQLVLTQEGDYLIALVCRKRT
jgi:hypothetical protein